VTGNLARLGGPPIRRWCTRHDLRLTPDGGLRVHANACDLVRRMSADTCRSSVLSLDVDGDGTRVTAAIGDPPSAFVERLAGTSLRGLRRQIAHLASRGELDPLLAQSLDDLPVAVMIADYGRLRTATDRTIRIHPGTAGQRRIDVCAGWAADAELATAVRERRPVRLTEGRAIGADDLASWCAHTGPRPTSHVVPGDQARRRVLEARREDRGRLVATSRLLDTYVEADGRETVLHEYTVTIRFDEGSRVIHEVEAIPGELPAPACSSASQSADDLVGTKIDTARELVAERFRGPRTCTHLNDVLRSLGQLVSSLE